MRTTAKRSTVIQAIQNVNEEHGYKIELNRDDQIGKWFNFTIKSEKSKIPGARISASGRNLVSASWHAHGYLYEEIFKIEPEAIIKSLTKTITVYAGNWQDWNCGSMFSPVYMSETSIL